MGDENKNLLKQNDFYYKMIQNMLYFRELHNKLEEIIFDHLKK